MELSVIVIGRNSERTLPECIGAICNFALQSPAVNVELLYVDSASCDSSINVVKHELVDSLLSWKIISVQSVALSAALGRFIGMQCATYNNILFVDSDMVVKTDWLSKALAQRDHRILSGQRYEVFLDHDTCWIADPNYYKQIDLGKVTRPGGLFLLFDVKRTTALFTPYLRSEEEADFVSQDLDLHDSIFRTSDVAFVHLNRKKLSVPQRLYENLRGMPAMSNYICGRIEAIRRGDYLVLVKSSYFYEIGVLCSLMLYGGVLSANWKLIAGALIFVILSKRKGAIGYRSVVFPFELMLGLFHFFRNKKCYKPEYVILASGGPW